MSDIENFGIDQERLQLFSAFDSFWFNRPNPNKVMFEHNESFFTPIRDHRA